MCCSQWFSLAMVPNAAATVSPISVLGPHHSTAITIKTIQKSLNWSDWINCRCRWRSGCIGSHTCEMIFVSYWCGPYRGMSSSKSIFPFSAFFSLEMSWERFPFFARLLLNQFFTKGSPALLPCVLTTIITNRWDSNDGTAFIYSSFLRSRFLWLFLDECHYHCQLIDWLMALPFLRCPTISMGCNFHCFYSQLDDDNDAANERPARRLENFHTNVRWWKKMR